MYDGENSVISAIRSGARHFVLKRAFSSELLGALRTVARGGLDLSSQVSDRLLTHIQRGHLRTHERSLLEARFALRASSLAAGRRRQDQNCGPARSRPANRGSYRKTMMKKPGANNVEGPTRLALAEALTHWDIPDENSLG